MRFEDFGLASAYVCVPLGRFDDEAGKIWHALRKTKLQKDAKGTEIVHLLGQADLLLTFRIPDFRRVLSFQHESVALNTNWVFGIPLKGGEARPPRFDCLRFVTHLRFRRGLRAHPGTALEDAVVDYLESTLRRLADTGVTASLNVGLGWSDLIMDGDFSCPPSQFLDFLLDITDLRFSDERGNSFPAFQRILTVMGYTSAIPRRLPSFDRAVTVQPLVQLRATPGSVPSAYRALEKHLFSGGELWRTALTDGKWDLVVTPSDGRIPLTEFLKRHRRLADHAAERMKAGDEDIEKTETHLVHEPASTDRLNRVPVSLSIPSMPTPCTCSRYRLRSRKSIRSGQPSLPSHFIHAVQNTVCLLESALQDKSACCDAYSAVVSCDMGLQRLLRDIEAIQTALTIQQGAAGAAAKYLHAWHGQLMEHIEVVPQWCSQAERVLRQRTIGSFKEILGQGDRAISYRGGVQKLIQLVDSLLNEFAENVADSNERAGIRLTALYDSVQVIESEPLLGVVSIPVRHLFLLPLNLPDLWHEVGQHIFQLRFGGPDNRRFRRVRHGLYEALFRGDHHLQSAERGADAMAIDELAMSVDLGDHYADLVVFLNGFQGQLQQFVESTSGAQIATPVYQAANPSTRRLLLCHILVRMYRVAEFDHWRRAAQKAMDMGEDPESVASPEWFEACEAKWSADVTREKTIGRVNIAMTKSPAFRETRAVREVWEDVRNAVSGRPALARKFRELQAALVTKKTRKLFDHLDESLYKRMAEGEVVDLSGTAVISDYFLKLHLAMLRKVLLPRPNENGIPKTPPQGALGEPGLFGFMAALGRSASLAFGYREWMRKQTPDA
jgi:hypothetical protein